MDQTPQRFLYFLPLPQGHESLRPTLGIIFIPGKEKNLISTLNI